MPRNHVRKLGARKYRDYSTDKLDIAVEKVLAKEISMRQASINYKIPFGTLHNKIKKKHTLSIGGQTALRKEEEIGIIRNVVTCAEWGFPLNILDLRMFTKIYLDSAGRNITKFKNNLPGQEWAYSLLKRHRSLIGQRMATNISRARAEVSPQVITNFFCNLENTIKGNVYCLYLYIHNFKLGNIKYIIRCSPITYFQLRRDERSGRPR